MMVNDVWSLISLRDDVEDLGAVDVDGFVEGRAFRLEIASQSIELEVALPRGFPLRLPSIFLRESLSFGLLPHVDERGFVCFSEGEGLLLDSENPAGVVAESIELASCVIRDGLQGVNHHEFAGEFESYWARSHSESVKVTLQVSLGELPTELYVIWSRRTLTGLVYDEQSLPTLLSRRRLPKRLRKYSGIYIPLAKTPLLIPPSFDQCWSLEELRQILKERTLDEHVEQVEMLYKRMGAVHYLILGVPHPDGGRSFIGVGLPSPKQKHQKQAKTMSPLSTGAPSSPFPIHVNRVDPDYVVERGGGNVCLKERCVMIVGCGAVGSVVADLLVKSGVRNLRLVDFDHLELANIHRHSLGNPSVGQEKAIALRRSILERFPHVDVEAVVERIENLVENDDSYLEGWDLVVFATGNPTVELAMNKLLHDTSTPAIYTWLEPYGIGGHALLVNAHHGVGGCFRCLYEVEGELFNRASFAALGQSFSRRMGGCQSSFVPYGGIHATRTACMASELACRFLLGRTVDHPLLSWKGDSTEFEAQGLHLSSRYQAFNQTQLDAQCHDYKSERCPICHSLE